MAAHVRPWHGLNPVSDTTHKLCVCSWCCPAVGYITFAHPAFHVRIVVLA